jgi:hypothetical protein
MSTFNRQPFGAADGAVPDLLHQAARCGETWMIRWLDVSAAPRNGTPVILWVEDRDAPPHYPVTVGVWETDDITGVNCWRVFADHDGTHNYFDQHIRGWMPLPRLPNA